MKNFLTYLILFALTISGNVLFAQVGLGTLTPDPSSELDVNSTTRGMLTPRMTQAQRNAITAPAEGLLIYQTDQAPGFYFRQGVQWIKSSTAPDAPHNTLSIIPFSSGVPVRIIPQHSGLENLGSIIGFSNATLDVPATTPTIDVTSGLGNNVNHAMIMPINGTIKFLSASFTFTGTVPTQEVYLYVKIYRSDNGVSFYYTGQYAFMAKGAGNPVALQVLRNDLDLFVPGGTHLMMFISATSNNGNAPITGFARASLGIQ